MGKKREYKEYVFKVKDFDRYFSVTVSYEKGRPGGYAGIAGTDIDKVQQVGEYVMKRIEKDRAIRLLRKGQITTGQYIDIKKDIEKK